MNAWIAPLGAGMNVHAARLARELRRQGVAVIAGDETFKLKNPWKQQVNSAPALP